MVLKLGIYINSISNHPVGNVGTPYFVQLWTLDCGDGCKLPKITLTLLASCLLNTKSSQMIRHTASQWPGSVSASVSGLCFPD